MQPNLTNNDLAAQLARHDTELDSLDRGVLENGLVAALALQKAETVERMLRAVARAAGCEDAADAQASYADPAITRAQGRRQRIAASGLRLVQGGGCSV
jgi:hypothetical protein